MGRKLPLGPETVARAGEVTDLTLSAYPQILTRLSGER